MSIDFDGALEAAQTLYRLAYMETSVQQAEDSAIVVQNTLTAAQAEIERLNGLLRIAGENHDHAESR